MSVLYLVRHGQASFGTDDYDRLSDLGKEQSRITGRFLASQGLEPDRIIHGEMLRQRQTAEGLLAGLGRDVDAHVDAGWNEYAAWELTGVLTDLDPRAQHDSKIFQGELERGAARWASGEHDEDYTETYNQFTSRVERALADAVAAMESGQSAIVVSSAGAIAWTAARLIGGGFDQWMAFNRVTINTGITKIITGRGGTSLISFNDHGHQDPKNATYR
ncbi:histidine phosphatase family protein [Brevibacterium linens]|uniref:Broad specificity phosphatase PhoE n=1 Tax=Brevibacterium linens ATCC 9172 TaxID=1255617 RepID=A0A2H1JEG4_BRELN|nr:histidine phosphatase family protein [Brevibacterium linens]KAB1947923.1 histidine phosphatase family protein [Brevibacterium linens ATCC 9172]SMX85552.1 Broad specificity phosphatase PhoE [Brevibacterium linens ATCC 9172]